MAKKKPHRSHGHYCKVCGEYKANEKFSGKGHAAHICKVCAGLSAEERSEKMTLNKLENMFGGGISKEQKKWLENRPHDSRLEVAETTQMVYNSCFPYVERNVRKKQLTIDTLCFEVNTEVFMEYGDLEQVHQVFTADRHSRVLTFRDLERQPGAEHHSGWRQDCQADALGWHKPTLVPWRNPFPDVKESAWYWDAVEYVCTQGLMNGYENGKFGPNDTITRAEFAQIIYNKEGRPSAGSGKFTDVKPGQWYVDAINWAAETGVVDGIGGSRYAPNDPITREQLATML